MCRLAAAAAAVAEAAAFAAAADAAHAAANTAPRAHRAVPFAKAQTAVPGVAVAAANWRLAVSASAGLAQLAVAAPLAGIGGVAGVVAPAVGVPVVVLSSDWRSAEGMKLLEMS